MQHPANGIVTLRVSRGETLLCLEWQHGQAIQTRKANMTRQSRAGILVMQGNHVLMSNIQSPPKSLHAMDREGDYSVQECIHYNSYLLCPSHEVIS